LKFPYKQFPRSKGGYVYHAVLDVYIALPEPRAPRSKKIEAFIDSGASRTIFHASIGRALGFQIEKGELEEPLGITGKPSKTYIHDIALYVPGGVIQIRGAFSEDLPVAGILGMEGFFEHFKLTFDSAARQIVLERIFHA
jgi:hypothetical protein